MAPCNHSREQSEDVLESQAEEEPPEFLQELHDMTLPVGQTTLSLEIRVRGKVYSIPHLDNYIISTLLFMSNLFSASLLSSCITWCHVFAGVPEPRVYWFKDGRALQPSVRIAFSESPGGLHSLLVSPLLPEDAGEYTVCASSTAGCVYTSAAVFHQGDSML